MLLPQNFNKYHRVLVYFSAFLNLNNQSFTRNVRLVMLLADPIPSDNGTSKSEGQSLTFIEVYSFSAH